MVNRSTRFVGCGFLGGVAASLLSGFAAVANPVGGFPPAQNPGTVDPAVAEATYQQNYQSYSQLLNQVTSINQFRDVSPAEWSYEALKNLVENYGCIVGYPDLTYRGDRPLSRNEFAAGLSACLTQLERRMMDAKQQLQISQGGNTTASMSTVEPGDTLNNVFTRAFYNSTGRFYDITSISGQANKIFGWRTWPGSFFDNMITEDAAVVEAVYDDAMQQQTQGETLRTMDLGSPFDQSLREKESVYTRFGNPPLPPNPSSPPRQYPPSY